MLSKILNFLLLISLFSCYTEELFYTGGLFETEEQKAFRVEAYQKQIQKMEMIRSTVIVHNNKTSLNRCRFLQEVEGSGDSKKNAIYFAKVKTYEAKGNALLITDISTSVKTNIEDRKTTEEVKDPEGKRTTITKTTPVSIISTFYEVTGRAYSCP